MIETLDYWGRAVSHPLWKTKGAACWLDHGYERLAEWKCPRGPSPAANGALGDFYEPWEDVRGATGIDQT